MFRLLRNFFTLPMVILNHLFSREETKTTESFGKGLKPEFYKLVKRLLDRGVNGVRNIDPKKGELDLLDAMIINSSKDISKYFTYQNKDIFIVIDAKSKRIVGLKNLHVLNSMDSVDMEAIIVEMVNRTLACAKIILNKENPINFITLKSKYTEK